MLYNIVVFLQVLLIQAIFLNFVLKMERNNCECSEDRRRDIIKYYSGFMVLSSLMILLMKKNCNWVCSLITMMNGIYTAIVVSYILKLRKDNCECAKTWGSDVMYYYALLALVVLAVLVINMLGFAYMIKK